jgi:uracil-DNA glycosylase
VHGQARKRDGRVIFAMYHPAAALHQPKLRQDLLNDIKKLPAILAEIDAVEEARPPEEPPQQLSLF